MVIKILGHIFSILPVLELMCAFGNDLSSRVWLERYIHCPKNAPPAKTNLTLAMIEESEYNCKDKISMRRWYEAQLEKDYGPPPPSKAPPIPSLGGNAKGRRESGDYYHGDDHKGETRGGGGGFYQKALSRSSRAASSSSKGMK